VRVAGNSMMGCRLHPTRRETGPRLSAPAGPSVYGCGLRRSEDRAQPGPYRRAWKACGIRAGTEHPSRCQPAVIPAGAGISAGLTGKQPASL
jgi:hypothetical protein